ncbi:hypothetical protein KHS38_05835 [Mucilaginibacter sp. Bleaf8]|uniref:hypothetical protein n=1 Tax=Mucilaginibacter sp. Bleaf8 TaxID=2834430 RepID=UPI001BD0414C|nr:hypothetical protein [Mucilaginibacter sp. Bleaf8]MBS7563919.1 hypothetical protein [Mucilaginibacter sp. Bleaf8]
MASEENREPLKTAGHEQAGTENNQEENGRSSAEVEKTFEMDPLQQAYDASTPSYELNLDSGDTAGGKVGSENKDEQDGPNIKQ